MTPERSCAPQRGAQASWLAAAALAWLAGCASQPEPLRISKPEGPGPFPAVVLMHDCSGLGPASSGAPGRWAQEFLARGYVVIVPDSFTPRGHAGGVCTVPLARRRADVGPRQRARDAHEALKHLRTLPYVDARRVAIMGGSHGGASTLVAMEQAGFAAAVALYPRCVPQRTYAPAGPVLILIGERDDWTPADACRRLTEASRTAGYRVTIKVYPGVHHSFDSPYPVRYVAARVNPNAPGGLGATTGGDPVAWADSIREVFTFLERQLK